MSNWLNKLIPSLSQREQSYSKSKIPEGVWDKCKKCEAILYLPELKRNLYVCPKCDYHFRLSARDRLQLFLNETSSEELFTHIESTDPLKFKDSKKYKDRISQAQKTTGEKEAMLCIKGFVHDIEVLTLASDFNFMGGSMGSAVGEKFFQAGEYCLTYQIPLICFAVSGGARMQESLFSLMQMARTSAVIEKMREECLPFISILADPCYGGVTASYAMLGDINIAEPNASIGFAGPRVIEQTVREKLPSGFQSSEFLLEHGTVDMVVHRHGLRDVIARLLRRLTKVKHFEKSILLEKKYNSDIDFVFLSFALINIVKNIMSFPVTLNDWLKKFATEMPEHHLCLGLERMKKVFPTLIKNKIAKCIVTVGGTNGKGSTLAFLSSILKEAGTIKYGLTCSPHLFQYNERIQINGYPVTDEQLCEAFKIITNVSHGIPLTYFELTTLAAFYLFSQCHLDIVLLEVGLGGRFDAVNIADHDIAVITTVALDHQQWLGHTIEKIAEEKSGIFRPNKPAIFGDLSIPKAIINKIHSINAIPFLRNQQFFIQKEKNTWTFISKQNSKTISIRDLPFSHLPFTSAICAVQVACLLQDTFNLSHHNIRQGIETTQLAGRNQVISYKTPQHQNVLLRFDVAHNPQASEHLAAKLKNSTCQGKRYALIAMLKNKDFIGTLFPLKSLIDEWFTSTVKDVRQLNGKILHTWLINHQENATFQPDINVLMPFIFKKMVTGDELVIFGSFHTVKEGFETLKR